MNKDKSTEMKYSSKAGDILQQINSKTKLGDLRKIAKDIKKITNLLWNFGRPKRFCPDY